MSLYVTPQTIKPRMLISYKLLKRAWSTISSGNDIIQLFILSMMETKERKLWLRRERERASRANEKEARTSLAQLMLHEHFLVTVNTTSMVCLHLDADGIIWDLSSSIENKAIVSMYKI